MSAPYLRTCPVTGAVVVFAPERALRPVPAAPPPAVRADCPLCPGREADTPRESFSVRDRGTPADGPGWRLRVVPNKFPFARPPRPGEAAPECPVGGVHELVVETERHCDPAALSPDEMARVVLAYRDRLRHFAGLDWCEAVVAFRNVGREAGASLDHPHSQVVALPLVPPLTAREWAGAAAYQSRAGACFFCTDFRDPARLVARAGGFVAACPPAPRFAYETWLVPSAHAGRFEDLTDDAAPEVGRALLGLFARLRRVVPGAAFNLTLHTAPVRGPVPAGWHWHFKLLPRTGKPAGFEWATGCFVNPVPPEFAAQALRG